MEREKMTKESRDELLERILEETARKPYKPTGMATRSASRSISRPTPKPVSQPVKAEKEESVALQPENKPQPKKKEEATQVFSNAEVNALIHGEEPKQEKNVTDDLNIAQMQEQSAADKIQKIKQAKAAAAKAAVMRKAELDNSIMMQNQGNFEADDEDEKVNIVLPEDEYLNDFADEYDEGYEPVNTTLVIRVCGILHYVFAVFFLFFVLFNFIFCFTAVDGESMNPTLSGGNIVLSVNVAYTPQRGDIAIIDNQIAALLDENGSITEKKALECKIAKRIIALGGDTVEIDFDNGIVKVNGETLTETYISEPTTRDSGAFTYPLTIPEGYAFVLGDNRNISKDSRHEDIGLVPVDEIEGKVIFGISPFGKVE